MPAAGGCGDSVFSCNGDPACFFSSSLSFSLSELPSIPVDGRGDSKLPKGPVRLPLERSPLPLPRTLASPINMLPNFRTTVAPTDAATAAVGHCSATWRHRTLPLRAGKPQKLDILGIGMQHQNDPDGIVWRQYRDFDNVLVEQRDQCGDVGYGIVP
jgi:hypothetical protein